MTTEVRLQSAGIGAQPDPSSIPAAAVTRATGSVRALQQAAQQAVRRSALRQPEQEMRLAMSSVLAVPGMCVEPANQSQSVILAIDFEASCLPRDGRSFPIEVGLASPEGQSWSWLIRPAPQWHDWSWSAEAEALHGISRARLEEEGLTPAEVMAELASVAAGARVIADSDLDDRWLGTLAAAAAGDAVFARPPFRIGHVHALLDELGTTRPEVVAAEKRIERFNLRRHYARDDALRLAYLIGDLTAAAEVRMTNVVASAG